MTNPETQCSRKEGSQYGKKKNARDDTLKVEDGNVEDFFPLSCLTKSFENVIHISNVLHRI